MAMGPNDFDRFVAENANAFLRTAYLMVGDLHEAEDVVQETLLKVASRWPRVRRMANPAGYARRILVQNGWVAAWWPGNAHLASAQLTTPSGTQTQTFATYPCDVHSCAGSGSHGGSRGGGPGGG